MKKKDFQDLMRVQGWERKEQKLYLQVAAAFKNFLPQDLAKIEPRTIFLLAQNGKKYQPVIDQLANLPEINQAVVRGLIEAQRKPRQQPQTEKPSIWFLLPTGERACKIPLIREDSQRTGMLLQDMIDTEGLSVQAIIAEAIELRKEFLEGRLVYVEQKETEEQSSDNLVVIVEPVGSKEELEITPNFSDIATVEITEVIEYKENPSLQPISSEVTSIEGILEKENITEVETKSQVELLIEILQNATSWREISNALVTYNECEKEAWEALTPLERQRVMRLTPVGIQKLSQAKEAGKIVDFQEVRDGVYQVEYEGSLFRELLTVATLDAFLTQF